jgi:ribosomal subunit interface protein
MASPDQLGRLEGLPETMQVQITGKNLNVGHSLTKHIEERLQQIAERYFDGSLRARVTVEKERAMFVTDCNLHLATGLLLQANGNAAEALPSFEQAATHLEKQLRRYKNRLKNHHKSRAQPVASFEAQSFVIAAPDESEQEPADLNPVVIAESPTSVPELSVGEAVMQLDISTIPFVVFKSARDGCINLVYRRQDGNIGWLDTGAANSAQ